MFAKQRLNELAWRRRLLVMEADLRRSIIALDRASLRTRLAGFRSTGEKLVCNRPALIAGGAVAGLLAKRQWRKLLRWIPAAWTGFRWVWKLRG